MEKNLKNTIKIGWIGSGFVGQLGHLVHHLRHHLFTEKPMPAALEQAERLVATGKDKNLLHEIGFIRRHDEGVQAAKRILNELKERGEVGPIRFVRAFCFTGNDWCNIYGEIKTDEPRSTHMVLPIIPMKQQRIVSQDLKKYYKVH